MKKQKAPFKKPELETTPFGDKDFMPIGKHAGKALANVPASWLLWWKSRIDEQNTSLGGPLLRLKLYIEDNHSLLIDEKKKEDQQKIENKNEKN